MRNSILLAVSMVLLSCSQPKTSKSFVKGDPEGTQLSISASEKLLEEIRLVSKGLNETESILTQAGYHLEKDSIRQTDAEYCSGKISLKGGSKALELGYQKGIPTPAKWVDYFRVYVYYGEKDGKVKVNEVISCYVGLLGPAV